MFKVSVGELTKKKMVANVFFGAVVTTAIAKRKLPRKVGLEIPLPTQLQCPLPPTTHRITSPNINDAYPHQLR